MKATLIALDTNVWLRYLLDDDAVQSPEARRLLDSAERGRLRFLLPVTVLLEVAWVLRSKGADTEAVALGLATLLGLPHVFAPEHDAILRALAWHSEGMDMADALHLALSERADEFRSFDERFVKVAKRLDALPVVMSPTSKRHKL
jgi:predicted nucleic acid-binding protein